MVGSTVFIAVDRYGGSGKSTLASWLSERLSAEIVHADDFASWEDRINWWPLVIERVFEPIKNGAKVLNYLRSKWWGNHHPEPALNQPVTDIPFSAISSERISSTWASTCWRVDVCVQNSIMRGLPRIYNYRNVAIVCNE